MEQQKPKNRRKNPKLKSPNEETVYTPEQLQELKLCMADPVYFAKNYVKIQHPKKGAIPFELYDYQVEMMRAFKENRYNIVLSSRQTGKALALDTKVPTPSGWSTIADIQPDDYVLSPEGTPVKVEAISDIMYDHDCYEVVFSTGDSFIADAEHLWSVKNESTKKEVVLTTQEIVDMGVLIDEERNQARFSVKTSKPLNLPEQNLLIDPYTLGVWLGDGTSRTGEITSHKDDIEIYEYIDQKYKINQRIYEDKQNIMRTTLYGLYPELRQLSLLKNKHIPDVYKRSSFQQRLALLQGLMDTDGYADKRGNGLCEISLSNKRLAYDTYELISSLGLKATIKEKYNNNFLSYRINFSAYHDEMKVFRLSRKLKYMKKEPSEIRHFSTKKRSIQKITKVDSVPVKCIRVASEDHLFLIGEGFIPTHNSITSAIFLLWFAMFNFDKKILIASNKNKGAMEMIRRIRYAYENLPHWLKPGVLDDGWNLHSIAFDNYSRIDSTATSEDSGRGESISILYLDEFAFVKRNIQNEFWTSILPTLSTGGSCIMSSTPNGDNDLFATLWRAANVQNPVTGRSDDDVITFVPMFIPWTAPPDRDEKFKQQQIALIGELKWKQEYECEFLTSDTLLMNSVFLGALTATVEKNKPLYEIDGIKFYTQIKEGAMYVIGVDPSAGTGNDFSAIEVFEFPSLEQVAEFRSNTMSGPFIYNLLKNLIKYLEKKNNTVYFSIENNGVGQGVISMYETDLHPSESAEFLSETGKNRYGMTTTNAKKIKACLTFKQLLENGNMTIKSNLLLNELKGFARKGGTYAAQSGSTDDCVSATLIVMRVLEEMALYEEAAYDKLYNHAGEQNWWERLDEEGQLIVTSDGEEKPEDDEPLPFIIY